MDVKLLGVKTVFMKKRSKEESTEVNEVEPQCMCRCGYVCVSAFIVKKSSVGAKFGVLSY